MAFTVQTNRTDYEYDIHSLVKAFYPQESVNVLTPHTGESKRKELLEDLRMEVLLFRNGEGSDGAKIAFFSEDGKKTVHSFAYTGDEEDEKEFKKATKRFLYEVLTEETGRSLPWGNLTGIRPTKIAMGLLEEGSTPAQTEAFLRESHFVSGEKAALAVDIAEREKNLSGYPL